MDARLEFCGNRLEFCDLTFYSEELERGNPYNCTSMLKVESYGFAGASYCEFDMRHLRTFVNELKEMYAFRKKEVEIQEVGYGGTLCFSADKTGHIKIGGRIFGSACVHELKFSFEADQTVLGKFISEMQLFTNN